MYNLRALEIQLNKLLTILTLTPMFILAGCQDTGGLNKKTEAVDEIINQGVINAGQVRIKKTHLCKTSSPPIKDKSKLKTMLINSGKITAEMSDKETKTIIKNYINKKQQAFKRCKK